MSESIGARNRVTSDDVHSHRRLFGVFTEYLTLFTASAAALMLPGKISEENRSKVSVDISKLKMSSGDDFRESSYVFDFNEKKKRVKKKKQPPRKMVQKASKELDGHPTKGMKHHLNTFHAFQDDQEVMDVGENDAKIRSLDPVEVGQIEAEDNGAASTFISLDADPTDPNTANIVGKRKIHDISSSSEDEAEPERKMENELDGFIDISKNSTIRSYVWKHFLLNRTTGHAKCKYCKYSLLHTKTSGTGNMMNHLRKIHDKYP